MGDAMGDAICEDFTSHLRVPSGVTVFDSGGLCNRVGAVTLAARVASPSPEVAMSLTMLALLPALLAPAPGAPSPSAPVSPYGPTIGAAVVVGPAHGRAVEGQAEALRLDLRLHVLAALGGARLGGELHGSIEGLDDTSAPCGPTTGEVRPSIAEACIESTLALRALAGYALGDLDDRLTLRVEAGAGPARRWLSRGGGDAEGRWALSWTGRGFFGVALGRLAGAVIRVGPTLEVAGYGDGPARWGGGLVVEGTSFD